MTDSALQRAAGALLQRFRRQRPLRGGSLIVTIFGDAIAPRGGTISLGSLIRLTEPFGLTERLVRTSVARLAADDWLEAQREGRLSYYRLTGNGRARFAEATQRIYAQNPHAWNGRWTLVVLPQDARAREKTRDELKWLGFGQPAPGLLVHPVRTAANTRERLRDLQVLDEAIVMESAAASTAENARLAASGWNLAELAKGYRRFIAMFEQLHRCAANPGPIDPETAFIIRTLLIHEYRKIHLRDPLLPQALLPQDWIGAQAYELCKALYAQTFGAAEAFLSAVGITQKGTLPKPSPDTLNRFGGL